MRNGQTGGRGPPSLVELSWAVDRPKRSVYHQRALWYIVSPIASHGVQKVRSDMVPDPLGTARSKVSHFPGGFLYMLHL